VTWTTGGAAMITTLQLIATTQY